MILVLAAKPRPSIDMSEIKQQEQGSAPAEPRARRHWEWFWRIVAGLMLLVIAWVVWVLYQITPRSVVTPLAYATRVRPISTPQSAGGAMPSAPEPVPEPAAADAATGRAQAALQTGAQPASADIQAAVLEQKDQTTKVEGLRFATEISTPLAEKQGTLKTQEGRPGIAPASPAATEAGGKGRP